MRYSVPSSLTSEPEYFLSAAVYIIPRTVKLIFYSFVADGVATQGVTAWHGGRGTMMDT